MTKFSAFMLGVREFRSDYTTSFSDFELLVAYDWGREWAHRLTFHRWD